MCGFSLIHFFIIGDDYVAIKSGSKLINITDINCGLGHGIRLVVQILYNLIITLYYYSSLLMKQNHLLGVLVKI